MTAPIFLFASWAVMSSGVAVKVSITVFLAAAETCPSNAHKTLKHPGERVSDAAGVCVVREVLGNAGR